MSLNITNKQQLKNINDTKLLKLTRRVYQMYEEGLVSETALHYLINEVSGRHYGFDDVDNTTWLFEILCFSNDELVKIVKLDTAKKFLKNGGVGCTIIPIGSLKSVSNDDKGNLLFFS